MDKCREAFERFECEKYECNYDDMKKNWDWYESQFGYRYSPDSLRGKDWAVWQKAWQHQQVKVDEKNKLLIDQGQRFNEQAQYVKDLEHEKYELQKRLDGSLQEIAGATRWIQEDAIDDTEFLKGGVLAAFRRIEQTLKVGHSIFFEAGDKVVFDNRIVSDDILTIDEILEDGVKFRGNFFHARYLNQMRHATSEEIALGRRIIILSSED